MTSDADRFLLFAVFLTSTLLLSECTVHHGNHTLARYKRQNGKCRADQFECASGECVLEDHICDGAEQCKDGSDENDCSKIPCVGYAFKCAYGACINSDHVCDGKKHCKDNSDETDPKCKNGNAGNINLSTCGRHKFNCDDASCIDDFDLCDGKADCPDASDESAKACGSLKCRSFYKCDYGACINANLRCNGANDCYDGSDEKNCPGRPNPTPIWTKSPDTVTPSTAPPAEGKCTLPPYPQNGKWQVFGPGSYAPGNAVDSGAVLKFECNAQFAPYPNNQFAYCDNGWTQMPQCLKTCSAIKSNDRVNAVCTLNRNTVNCTSPYQGTEATLSCNPLYEDPLLENRPNRICDDGSWDYPLPQCVPVCGLKSTEATPLVIGGAAAKKGDYPWMIGLYTSDEKKHICGGSMITPSITLTAAHCFELSADPRSYLLAAGKYYREYRHDQDKHAQYSNVKEIKIHDDFKDGEAYFAFDIAILVLETPFKISSLVLPVCIDLNPRFDETALVDAKGVVVGWGFTTSTNAPSDVLKVLEVAYKTQATCTLPDDFRKFYTLARDKMCAGSDVKGQSACRGDSGGGLYFKKGDRYYIRGIVSVSARDKATLGCDSNEPTLFTGVHHHAALIQSYMNRNRVKDLR